MADPVAGREVIKDCNEFNRLPKGTMKRRFVMCEMCGCQRKQDGYATISVARKSTLNRSGLKETITKKTPYNLGDIEWTVEPAKKPAAKTSRAKVDSSSG